MSKVDSPQSFFSSLFTSLPGTGGSGDVPTADASPLTYLFGGSGDSGDISWLQGGETDQGAPSSGPSTSTESSFDPIALGQQISTDSDESSGEGGDTGEESGGIMDDMMGIAKDFLGGNPLDPSDPVSSEE